MQLSKVLLAATLLVTPGTAAAQAAPDAEVAPRQPPAVADPAPDPEAPAADPTVAVATADPAAADRLRAFVDDVFELLDAGRMDQIPVVTGDELEVFDIGPDANPAAASGQAGWQAYAAAVVAAQAPGTTIESTITQADCHAAATIGYCAIEYDQMMTVAGAPIGPFRFRGTLVAWQEAGSWRLAHWHGSYAEWPEASPTPEAPIENGQTQNR